jgi:diguanylate cyclase (GGDEF)-like protein
MSRRPKGSASPIAMGNVVAGSRIAQLTKIPFGANEPLLHRALEAGGVGLWDYVPSSGLIDLYHNVLSFQRLKPGRYAGPVSDFTEYVLAEDRPAVTRMLQQCADGVDDIYVEFRIRTQNNDLVWLSCRGQMAKLGNGTTRYVGAITDITDASERELRLLAYHESLFSLARNPLVVDRADFRRAAIQIIDQAAGTLGVTRGGLWQFTEDCLGLRCLYQFDSRITSSVAAGHTLTAEDFPTYFAAISQRRSLAVDDALADPVLHEFRARYLPETGVRALLDVPVFHHGHLWGVVCFEDCSAARHWDADSQGFAGSAVDLLALAFEVSERAKSEAELAATRDRHRAFIQASLDSIWSVDVEDGIDTSLPPETQIAVLRANARITDANAAFTRDYKLDTSAVIGRLLAEFMPELFKGSSLRDWVDRGYRLIERELRLKVKGEDHHWLSLTLLGVVEDGKLVRIWGARRNITDRKRYQSLLEHLAFRDPLTGLLNRQRLVSEINEMIEVAEAQSADAAATLLLLDLNQFKDINDTLGHGAGDEVLRQMKTRFDEALSLENAVAARLGGDEFGVFARGVGTAEGAMRIGEAITTAIAQPFVIGGGKFHISASIGAAIYPTHGRSFSELSRAADEAMYHAKQTGGGVRLFSRNTVVFEQRKLLLLAGLPEAIDRGELVLEFQPIINCLTRKPVRMEALVRWNHPEYGRLTARDFVHKAEMSDSIRVLTRWVIETALQSARDWQASAPGVGVAINISPRLLGDSIIVAHLQKSIKKYGLPARLVDLEITETSLIHNPDRATQILADCRSQGFSIVIDDYGVGFCSLAYLRRLPLKGLKMDNSFVTRVMHNAEDAIIVQSTIALAHNLGLTVVAEGVEDAATLQFLQLHGCDFAQGYAIAHPLGLVDTLSWLRNATPPAPPMNPLRAVG